MTNAALIAKLEKAQEGSRALSDRVLLALGWRSAGSVHGLKWYRPSGGLYLGVPRPNPSRNLQDAVDLVPEGYGVCLVIEEKTGRGRAFIGPEGVYGTSGQSWAGYEVRNGKPVNIATPALALVVAILKAVEAKDG